MPSSKPEGSNSYRQDSEIVKYTFSKGENRERILNDINIRQILNAITSLVHAIENISKE